MAAVVVHYDDKADLLRALASQTLTELAARIRGAGERDGGRSRLHRGCAAYLAHALERPHHYQLIFGNTPVTEPDQKLESAADDGMLALRETVERAQLEGELGAGRRANSRPSCGRCCTASRSCRSPGTCTSPARSTATPDSTTCSRSLPSARHGVPAESQSNDEHHALQTRDEPGDGSSNLQRGRL